MVEKSRTARFGYHLKTDMQKPIVMDNAKAKALRKRLDSRILKLVAPKDMAVHEYKIACNLEEIDPTVENGQFLHWIMTAHDSDETNVADKVHNAVINALKKKYLLDTDNLEQCSYFCDAVRDIVLDDKDYAINVLEAVLKNYKDSPGYGVEVFAFCKQLNKGLGLTSVEYFANGYGLN